MPVGGPRVHHAVRSEHFDVAVHAVQLSYLIDALHSQRSIHRSQVLKLRSVRHVDRIFHVYFHTLILRITRQHGNIAGVRIHFNRHSGEIGLLELRGLHRVNFHHVLVPPLHFHCSIHVLQLKRSARLQRIRLVKVLADGDAWNRRGRQREHRHHHRNQQFAKFHIHSSSRMACQKSSYFSASRFPALQKRLLTPDPTTKARKSFPPIDFSNENQTTAWRSHPPPYHPSTRVYRAIV